MTARVELATLLRATVFETASSPIRMVTNVGGDDRTRTCNPVKGHSFPTSFLTIRIVSMRWRRVLDLNQRWVLCHDRLATCCFKPLSQLSTKIWCRLQDLNLYALRRYVLSVVCMPFHQTGIGTDGET